MKILTLQQEYFHVVWVIEKKEGKNNPPFADWYVMMCKKKGLFNDLTAENFIDEDEGEIGVAS